MTLALPPTLPPSLKYTRWRQAVFHWILYARALLAIDSDALQAQRRRAPWPGPPPGRRRPSDALPRPAAEDPALVAGLVTYPKY